MWNSKSGSREGVCKLVLSPFDSIQFSILTQAVVPRDPSPVSIVSYMVIHMFKNINSYVVATDWINIHVTTHCPICISNLACQCPTSPVALHLHSCSGQYKTQAVLSSFYSLLVEVKKCLNNSPPALFSLNWYSLIYYSGLSKSYLEQFPMCPHIVISSSLKVSLQFFNLVTAVVYLHC